MEAIFVSCMRKIFIYINLIEKYLFIYLRQKASVAAQPRNKFYFHSFIFDTMFSIENNEELIFFHWDISP